MGGSRVAHTCEEEGQAARDQVSAPFQDTRQQRKGLSPRRAPDTPARDGTSSCPGGLWRPLGRDGKARDRPGLGRQAAPLRGRGHKGEGVPLSPQPRAAGGSLFTALLASQGCPLALGAIATHGLGTWAARAGCRPGPFLLTAPAKLRASWRKVAKKVQVCLCLAGRGHRSPLPGSASLGSRVLYSVRSFPVSRALSSCPVGEVHPRASVTSLRCNPGGPDRGVAPGLKGSFCPGSLFFFEGLGGRGL